MLFRRYTKNQAGAVLTVFLIAHLGMLLVLELFTSEGGIRGELIAFTTIIALAFLTLMLYIRKRVWGYLMGIFICILAVTLDLYIHIIDAEYWWTFSDQRSAILHILFYLAAAGGIVFSLLVRRDFKRSRHSHIQETTPNTFLK